MLHTRSVLSQMMLGLLIFAFSACGEDFDKTRTTVINGEPIAADSSVIQGQILNEENQPLEQAIITLWNEGWEWSMVPDEEGRYRIAMPRDGSRLNIEFSAEGFVESVAVVDLNEPLTELNVNLLQPRGQIQPGSSPNVDQDLFVVEGRLLDMDGAPMPDIFINLSGNNSTLDFTDDDGYFTIVTKPFQNSELLIFLHPCTQLLQIPSTFPEGIDSDVFLGDIVSSTIANPALRTFKGEIRNNLDGSLLTDGVLLFNYYLAFFSFDSYDIENGSYNFEGSVCENHRFYNISLGNQQFVGLPLTGDIMERDFYVPVAGTIAPSTNLTLQVDGLSSDLDYATAQYDDQQRWIVSSMIPGSPGPGVTFGFSAPPDAFGDYPVDWITTYPDSDPTIYYSAIPEDGLNITVNITENDSGWVRGTVNGTLLDTNGNPVPFTGSFDSNLLNP